MASDRLALGPASRIVGVDPDTLRRWADEGRIAVAVTPGGHRRFERRDVERIAQSRRTGAGRHGLAALGATPDRLTRAYARSYARSGTLAPDGAAPSQGEPPALDREAFRADGRRLVGVLLAYLDASGAAARGAAEGEAVAIVRGTADRLAEAGLGADEAAAAFVAARRPFLGELAALGRRRSLDVADLASLYDDAVTLLDRLLLEFLSAFKGVSR
jgi:excisionase family DNA binding protein